MIYAKEKTKVKIETFHNTIHKKLSLKCLFTQGVISMQHYLPPIIAFYFNSYIDCQDLK